MNISKFTITHEKKEEGAPTRLYLEVPYLPNHKVLRVVCDCCSTLLTNIQEFGSSRSSFFVHEYEYKKKHRHAYSWASKEVDGYNIQYCWKCADVLEAAPVI